MSGTKEYIDIAELSAQLRIKRSTLYAMVVQGRIPHFKFGRLIRFRQDQIDEWAQSLFQAAGTPKPLPPPLRRTPSQSLDSLIARAKRGVYTWQRGKPDQGRAGKEGHDGSV